MEENLLKQIQSLIINLPSRDVPLGIKFVEERKFESLKELVDSAIQIDRNREASGKESLIKDFAKLATLKAKVDKYCSLLGITEQEEDDFNDFSTCEGWPDEYD